MYRYYCIITPEKESGFESEWNCCLDKLKDLPDKGKLFKLVIFVSASDNEEFEILREFVKKSLLAWFDNEVPAFTVLAEPPAGFSVAAEAGYFTGNDIQVSYKSYFGIPYVVANGEAHKEIWGCGMGNYPSLGFVEKDSIRAFEEMVNVLANEEMDMDCVVRQWNYIGEILRIDHSREKEVQNYQVFNEVRNRYYGKYRKKSGFPSATGIGTGFPGVAIDFCAVEKFSDNVVTKAVDNEKQQNPYAYGQEVLVGSPLKDNGPKQPPQFERARFLHVPGDETLFLSGTASIIGQETVGVGDVEKQTRVTIDHLLTLSAPSNVEKYAPVQTEDEGQWKLLRVYLKKEKDFSVVREICSKKFDHIPVAFVKADVCRDDLLVEIEGELSFS